MVGNGTLLASGTSVGAITAYLGTPGPAGADQRAEGTWRYSSDVAAQSLVLRYADASNYYELVPISGNQIRLRKVVAGVTTTLATYSWTISTTLVGRAALSIIGTALSVEVDGVLQTTITDASLAAAGSWGIVAPSNIVQTSTTGKRLSRVSFLDRTS